MYFIYRHVRLDTNEPFYIGVGTCKKDAKTHKSEFFRAYQKHGRNIMWTGISKKGYSVDIIYLSTSRSFIFEKEIEFIKLYGRRDLGLGTLTNMTDGGKDTIPSLEPSKRLKWRENIRRVKVYQYNKNGIFVKEHRSLLEALIQFGTTSVCALKIACKNNSEYLGNKWFYEYQGEQVEPLTCYLEKIKKSCTLIKDDEKLEFSSVKEAARFLNCSPSLIRRILLHKPHWTAMGYKVTLE